MFFFIKWKIFCCYPSLQFFVWYFSSICDYIKTNKLFMLLIVKESMFKYFIKIYFFFNARLRVITYVQCMIFFFADIFLRCSIIVQKFPKKKIRNASFLVFSNKNLANVKKKKICILMNTGYAYSFNCIFWLNLNYSCRWHY